MTMRCSVKLVDRCPQCRDAFRAVGLAYCTACQRAIGRRRGHGRGGAARCGRVGRPRSRGTPTSEARPERTP